jgi:glycosyltransferase involved in cell wall biosynthesis
MYNGYDLYEERQNGYIPFRYDQLKKINTAMPISENGKQYLMQKYPTFKSKIQKRILGAKAIGNAIMSNDNTLRIISCSNLIPLKRVEIIVAALMQISFDIQWIHIGGGELQTAIETACKKLPPNINWHITGKVTPNKVYNYYLNKQVDVFINISETEGLPVSIMEALSFGVPIFATNVGGTNELVSNATGKLLPKNITPQTLAVELNTFYNLPKQTKLTLRKNATNYFKKECDSTVLANSLCEYFLQ